MKKKLRKITQVIPVFLLVLFSSCEKENDTVNPQQRNYLIKEYPFDTAGKMAKSTNAFYKISEQLSKINKLDKSTSKTGMDGIKVDSSIIREISIGDYTTYTMLVKRDEQTADYFENIIIEVDGLEEIKTYLIKYTPSKPIAYVEAHDSYKFEGTMDKYQYPTCLACPEDDNDGENGNVDNTGTGFSSNYGCVTVMMCNQAWDGQTYGIEHIATSDCTNTYPKTICGYTGGTSGGGGGTGGTGGSGPSGGQSGTGTGNTNSNSPSPSSPVTSPVVPKPLDEKKCELFNKLKNDQPFKDIIQILKNGVNLTYEQGVALTNQPNGTYSAIVGVANPNEKYAVEFDVPNGTVIDILTHNHYTGGLTIFSPADLKQIYDYISTAPVDQGDNYVSVVVTPNPQDPQNPTVYAITITDRAKFIAYGKANFGTETKFDIFRGIFSLEKGNRFITGCFGINENHTSAENEASFLKLLGKTSGLKVHKTNADLSQWNPLKLNTNDSVLPEPSCN